MSPAIAEKCGTPQPQPMNAPISIAIPTDRPTKCPMPRSANDKKKSITAHGAALADPKCLGDVRRENLRGNDHRKHR